MVLATAQASASSEVATGESPSGGQYAPEAPASVPTGHMQCMLTSLTNKWAPQDAQTASDAFALAIKKMNLDPNKFNRTSMFHFLNMITNETGGGKKLTQDPRPADPDKVGYGYAQITHLKTLSKVGDCMNEVDPGSGKGVNEDPDGTIGQGAMKANPKEGSYKSMLASLCYWRDNLVNNEGNQKYITDASPSAVESVLRICGGGSPSGAIYGNDVQQLQSLNIHQRTFSEVSSADRTCSQ